MARAELWLYEAYHGDLPQVCICCGRPATLVRQKAFSTGLLGLPLIIIPFLPFLAILAGVTWVRAPFCDLHKNHWRVRTIISWVSFLAVISVGLASAALVLEYAGRQNVTGMMIGTILCPGFFLALLLWVVLVVTLKRRGVHIAAINEPRITLGGIAPEFVDALEVKRVAEKDLQKDTTFRRKPISWHFHFYHGT